VSHTKAFVISLIVIVTFNFEDEDEPDDDHEDDSSTRIPPEKVDAALISAEPCLAEL